MAFLIDVIAVGVVDSSGQPLASGKVYVYEVGTTTLANVYSDRELLSPISNPITLDSVGRAEAYVGEEVRVRIETSSGVLVQDIDTLGDVFQTEDEQTFQEDVTIEGNLTVDGDISVGDDLTVGDDLAVVGDLSAALLNAVGADTPGWINNLSMSYAAGTLTIPASTSSPGYVTVRSTTAGAFASLKVTANSSFNDDAHASSDLTNLGFGITETVHWAEDMPYFLYVANRANSNIDGVDGSSVFFIARHPCLSTTPSDANDIGDTGAIPTNDSQNVILIMQDVTVANYVSLPCQLIGSFRMRWSTTTDDWTVQSLGNSDGIGRDALASTFAKLWTFPAGQNGAASNNYIKSNGGTAPVFTSYFYKYKITPTGDVEVFVDFTADGGTDGAGAVAALLASPTLISTGATISSGNGLVTSVGTGSDNAIFRPLDGTTDIQMRDNAGTTINNNDFTNGGREIECQFKYVGFV